MTKRNFFLKSVTGLVALCAAPLQLIKPKSKSVKIDDMLKLWADMEGQQYLLARYGAKPERRVYTIDVGERTPAEQLEMVTSWRKALGMPATEVPKPSKLGFLTEWDPSGLINFNL